MEILLSDQHPISDNPLDAKNSVIGSQKAQDSDETIDDHAMRTVGPDGQNVIDKQMTPGNDTPTTPYL